MIYANNVMEAWKLALKYIRLNGFTFLDDEERECFEVENLTIVIKNVKDAKAPLHWIRAQSNWYYPSDEELHSAIFSYNPEGKGHYAYSSRIFSFQEKLNQLDDYVIPLMKQHPSTRRALISLTDPIADQVSDSRNFVSLSSIWFRIINEKVCITAVIRSNDILLGWAANIYQTSLLQEYVAKKLELPVGTITTISLSGHYFSEDAWLLEKLER